MKITKAELRELIKEVLDTTMEEAMDSAPENPERAAMALGGILIGYLIAKSPNDITIEKAQNLAVAERLVQALSANKAEFLKDWKSPGLIRMKYLSDLMGLGIADRE